MIVTCDHCGARYKLDDSKISGRGAKITCPRCRHVFVVYKDHGASADATPAPPPSAASASLEQPAPPAPPPANLDVHGLDFRKVGIQSWKVKVKIGLVYDFSDYKTLAKYIQDGRVTPSDLLSHNGSDWTPIGDLDDVKQHFIDVYVEAERAQAAEAAADASSEVADFEDDDLPTNIIGMDDLAGTLGAERANTATGAAGAARIGDGGGAVEELFKTGGAAEDAAPRFVDPFEQRKKSRERKAKGGASSSPPAAAPARAPRKAPPAQEEEKKGNGLVLLLVALVLLALGGGAWYAMQPDDTGPTTTAVRPPPQPIAPKAKATSSDDGSIVPEDAGDEVEEGEEDPWEVEEEQPMVPVVPDWAKDGRSPPPSGGPPPATPSSRASVGSQPTATPGVAYASMSAADHAQAGWDAYRRGDYASAVAAFRQAVSMSPGNPEYSGKLGAALLRAGDLGGARPPLQQAAGAGYAPAHEFLGDLDAELGDSPGAIQHYQDYLATGPGNAAQVQDKINRLNGT